MTLANQHLAFISASFCQLRLHAPGRAAATTTRPVGRLSRAQRAAQRSNFGALEEARHRSDDRQASLNNWLLGDNGLIQ
jgi:hypothetical protein